MSAPPSTLRRVLGATLNYGMAGYLPRLVNFVLLPVYAAYLDPTEMGIVEICIAIQLLMDAVGRLGLPGALEREYFDHREGEGLRDLVLTTSLGTLVASLGFGALILIAGPPVFARWLPAMPFHPYVELAVAASVLRFAPVLQARLLQAKEESRVAATITLVVSAVGTASKLVCVVALDMGVAGVLWADLLTAIVAFLIALLRHLPDLRGRLRPDLLRGSLAYAVPVIPHRFGAWVHQYAGPWILGAFGVLDAVGHLGVATRVSLPLVIGLGAFTTAFGPIYYQWRSDHSEEEALRLARETALATTGVSALAAVGISGFGTLFVLYLFDLQYREAAFVIGLLAAAKLLSVPYNLLVVEVFYSKRTRPVSIIFFAASVVTIGLTIVLAPDHGVHGVAWAQVAGGLVSVVCAGVLAVRTFRLVYTARGFLLTAVGCAASILAPLPLEGGRLGPDLAWTAAISAAASGAIVVLAGVSPLRRLLAARVSRRLAKKHERS